MAIDIQAIDAEIQALKQTAERLKQLGDSFPAVARNVARILASVKMLEIEVSDIVTIIGNK